MNSDYQSEYLHPYFHYHGMNKIKAGKGYYNGHPLGVLSGPCIECEGEIISLKINTSRKGMECTSEKVCNTCGLIYDGAFQILGKQEQEYHTRPYTSHEQWLEEMKKQETRQGNPEDIAIECELEEHETGHRKQTEDDYTYGETETRYKNINDINIRLNLAIDRLASTNESKKQPWQDWKDAQYKDLVDDYAMELGLLKYQIADVKWIIDHRYNMFDTRYKMEDIIYHICLYMKVLQLSRKATGILKEARLQGRYNRTLYHLVKAKLS